jgi:hypothetical protein
MAQYWVVVDGRQVGLPSFDEEEAKHLLRDHLIAEPSVDAFIEIYDGAKPTTKMSWGQGNVKVGDLCLRKPAAVS